MESKFDYRSSDILGTRWPSRPKGPVQTLAFCRQFVLQAPAAHLKTSISLWARLGRMDEHVLFWTRGRTPTTVI
jgi:hypothetical protein